MFIGKVKIDLKELVVFDKVYDLVEGDYILCKDGVMYNQIRAHNVEIIKENVNGFDELVGNEYLKVVDTNDKNIFIAIYGAEAWIKKQEEAGVIQHRLPVKDKKNGNSRKNKSAS